MLDRCANILQPRGKNRLIGFRGIELAKRNQNYAVVPYEFCSFHIVTANDVENLFRYK